MCIRDRDAYRSVFHMGNSIPQAYLVTIFITLAGTAIGLLTTSVSGYVLSRPDFKHRNKFAFFIYFTTLFSAGMIPSYLVNVKMCIRDSHVSGGHQRFPGLRLEICRGGNG